MKMQRTLGSIKKCKLDKRTIFFERAGKKHTLDDVGIPSIYFYANISTFTYIYICHVFIVRTFAA